VETSHSGYNQVSAFESAIAFKKILSNLEEPEAKRKLVYASSTGRQRTSINDFRYGIYILKS